MKLQPGLYIISTPIGNMLDITYRAIETMKNSDYIFSEDTRVTKKLLEKHQITAKLSVYNDHSDEEVRNYIKNLINSGSVVSLVSDAGTPLISDPGYKLVRDLQNEGLFVDIAPGVSSPIAALTLSGLPSDRFMFLGFLPKTIESKRKIFTELENLKATLIFFESPNRLTSSLEVALEVLSDREAVVAREITKLYQTIKRGKISQLLDFFLNNQAKGEIVLLISGEKVEIKIDDLEEEIKDLINSDLKTKGIVTMLHKKYPQYNKTFIYNAVKIHKIGK